VRHAQGHPDEAEALYRRALAIWEQALGPNHVRVAMVANNLAIAYRDQKKLDEAASLLQRSLAVRETVNGPDHLDVALGLGALAGVERARGR
jgi:tetratricopeptide (TPR) repeat protein